MPTLEELRRGKPMTQRELAAAAGVSESTVRAIETGRSKLVQPRVVRKIAEALQVSPADVAEFRQTLRLPPLPPERDAPKISDAA